MNWQEDTQYESAVLKSVTTREDGLLLEREDGWSFFVPTPPFAPEAGDACRYYGRGIGFPVRGVVVEGKGPLLYRTPEEEEERFKLQQLAWEEEKRVLAEEHGPAWDKMIAELPPPLRERIEGFEARNSEFRVDGLGYELCIAQAAARIAREFWGDPEGLLAWEALPWEERNARFEVDDGNMSGNQVGLAKRLGYLLLTDPLSVPKEHAGLCPLVGCKEAGCWAASGLEEKK